MRKTFFVIGFILLTLQGSCQPDKVFEEVVTFKKGFNFIENGTIQIQPYLGGASGATDWADITNKPTFATVATSGLYNDLLNKPVLFDGTWNSLTGKPTSYPPSAHNHDLLYKPISYVPTWAEITNKPPEVELIEELPKMAYLPLVQKTTTEINSTIVPSGVVAIVWDKTLGVMKIWNGTQWKTVITAN